MQNSIGIQFLLLTGAAGTHPSANGAGHQLDTYLKSRYIICWFCVERGLVTVFGFGSKFRQLNFFGHAFEFNGHHTRHRLLLIAT
jgi:hypothetical protein